VEQEHWHTSAERTIACPAKLSHSAACAGATPCSDVAVEASGPGRHARRTSPDADESRACPIHASDMGPLPDEIWTSPSDPAARALADVLPTVAGSPRVMSRFPCRVRIFG
jgi:hypothetical protein